MTTVCVIAAVVIVFASLTAVATDAVAERDEHKAHADRLARELDVPQNADDAWWEALHGGEAS